MLFFLVYGICNLTSNCANDVCLWSLLGFSCLCLEHRNFEKRILENVLGLQPDLFCVVQI